MMHDEFLQKMSKADILTQFGDQPNYWHGYRRGLRRRFHGEKFGTEQEHKLWMSLWNDEDISRQELGRGYRKAFEEEKVF